MTIETKALVPEGIRHDPDLSTLSVSDRTRHHTKQLRVIAFHQGIDGVAEYKRQHPEARSIRVAVNALAYTAKPKGYDDYLVRLVDQWLTTETAAAEANRTDVERLNANFGTSRFQPSNHFNQPLSAGRLEKLKAAFFAKGVHLDTIRNNTLSKVKAAARAARVHQGAGRPFGSVGMVSGNALIIGDQRLTIMQHHGHDAIKLPVNGKRVWLRLDVLAAAYDLLSGRARADPLSQTTTCSIREMVPDAETPDFDPLADIEIRGLVPDSNALPMGEVVPDPNEPRSLTDRVAALKAAQPGHSPACPSDVDPLTL